MSCKGCVYGVRLDGDWCCDFLSQTGHRRPCPPGDACTVRVDEAQEERRGGRLRERSWSGAALALYARGLSDRAIAKELGVSYSAVCFWRTKSGLPALYKRGGKPLKERNGG